MRRFVFVCIAVLLAACSTRPQPGVETRGTPIPLKEIDLTALVMENQNLPEGVSYGEGSSLPNMFANLPTSVNYVYQPFRRTERAAGGVGLFVYESNDGATRAYDQILSDFGDASQPVQNVGERSETISVSQKLNQSTLEFIDLVFQRCGAVGHIRISGTVDPEVAKDYATALDNRVMQVICR